jgi:hypothetical protein
MGYLDSIYINMTKYRVLFIYFSYWRSEGEEWRSSGGEALGANGKHLPGPNSRQRDKTLFDDGRGALHEVLVLGFGFRISFIKGA